MPIPLHDYSITVSGAPYKYDPALQMEFEATVANAIIRGQIAQTGVGKLVLSRIKNGPGDVEIYPRYKTGLNAEADYQLKSNSSGRLIGKDPHKIVVWFKPQQWKETLPASHATILTCEPSNPECCGMKFCYTNLFIPDDCLMDSRKLATSLRPTRTTLRPTPMPKMRPTKTSRSS